MLLSNIWKIWNVATQDAVFKTSLVSWGKRGEQILLLLLPGRLLSVKAHGKNARGFMEFWLQKCTSVYKVVQLWNIQCSLLCVWWSFSSYPSPESTLTMQIAMYYSPWVADSSDNFLRCLEKVFLLLLSQHSLLADQASPSRSPRTVSMMLEVCNH